MSSVVDAYRPYLCKRHPDRYLDEQRGVYDRDGALWSKLLLHDVARALVPCDTPVCERCCVCLEAKRSNLVLCRACRNTFHRACVQRCVTCPLCRVRIDHANALAPVPRTLRS